MKNWDEIMADYSCSGLSGKAYCRQMGLSYPTFMYHKKKRSAGDPVRDFLVVQTGTSSSGLVEVLYPNGVRLRLPATVRLSELKFLLDV